MNIINLIEIFIPILCAIGILRIGWIIIVKRPLQELGIYWWD